MNEAYIKQLIVYGAEEVPLKDIGHPTLSCIQQQVQLIYGTELVMPSTECHTYKWCSAVTLVDAVSVCTFQIKLIIFKIRSFSLKSTYTLFLSHFTLIYVFLLAITSNCSDSGDCFGKKDGECTTRQVVDNGDESNVCRHILI
jgi:hypothetical protein